jgi:hypothetical protein
MKPLIFISCIFIFALFPACQNDNAVIEVNSDTNNSEILSLVFDSIVGDKEGWKDLMLPVPFPLDHKAVNYSIDSIRQQREMDSIQFKLDSAMFTVFINDSMAIPSFDLDFIRSLSEKESFKSNFHGIDTAKRHLLINLIENNSSKRFDLSKINTSRDYTLKYLSSSKDDNTIIIGNVTFSQITYSHDETIACIYSSIVCGGECGYGNIYFLEKHDGTWKITSKHNLWVS